jgi:hypothetical protein
VARLKASAEGGLREELLQEEERLADVPLDCIDPALLRPALVVDLRRPGEPLAAPNFFPESRACTDEGR